MTKARLAFTMADVAMIWALSSALGCSCLPTLVTPRPHSSAAPPALLRPKTLKKRTQTEHKGGRGLKRNAVFPALRATWLLHPVLNIYYYIRQERLLRPAPRAPRPWTLCARSLRGRGVAHSLKQSQASGQEDLSSGFLFRRQTLQATSTTFAPTPSACKLLAFIVTNLVAWHTANNLESLSLLYSWQAALHCFGPAFPPLPGHCCHCTRRATRTLKKNSVLLPANAGYAHPKKTLHQVSATREFTAWHETLLPAKPNSFKSSPDSCRAACQEGANNRLAKLTGTACTNTHA